MQKETTPRSGEGKREEKKKIKKKQSEKKKPRERKKKLWEKRKIEECVTGLACALLKMQKSKEK